MSKYVQQAKATNKKRKYMKATEVKGGLAKASQKAKRKKASALGKAKPMSDAQKTLRQQRLRKNALKGKQKKLPDFLKKKITAKKKK